ncbi:chaplin [Streptomyces sp. NPDC006367]|uniref:chaplin n=1 Tax=unclassified Streptomyces TaxID=2593676 RepID=UPI0033AA8640
MTAEKGKSMKKSAAVVAGAVMTLGMATPAFADAGAEAAAIGSPGVLSGNAVQVPVHVPVNVCGNTVNIVGLLNPAAGNVCVND